MSAHDIRRINRKLAVIICQAITATLMLVMWIDGSSWAAPLVFTLTVIAISSSVATVNQVLRRHVEIPEPPPKAEVKT